MQYPRKEVSILKKRMIFLSLACTFMSNFALFSKSDAAGPLNIQISPNGKRVAVPMSIGICVYDTHTGEVISQFIETQTREKNTSSSTALPGALTFSMDAQIIASVHGNSVYVWETDTGTSIAILDKHPAAIKTLALSPDSAQLATTGEDWKVHLWDVKTGKAIRSLDHPSAVNAVAFSPDGKRLASAGGSLRLWDAYTGKLLHDNSKDLGSVNLLIFSRDGKILASGGEWNHTVHLWDVETGTPKKTLKGHTGEIRDLAFSRDGHTLLTVSKDKTLRLWDVETGTQRKQFYTPLNRREKMRSGKKTDDVSAAKFSQDGKYLIIASRAGTLHICSAETGRYQQESFDFNVSKGD